MSGLWLKAVLDNSGLLPLAGSGVMPVMMVSDMLGCLPSDFRGYLIELRRVKRSALSISRMRSASMRCWACMLALLYCCWAACWGGTMGPLRKANAMSEMLIMLNGRGGWGSWGRRGER